jgi:hypothetical protein
MRSRLRATRRKVLIILGAALAMTVFTHIAAPPAAPVVATTAVVSSR